MAGPSDYRTGTERALFVLSRGTRYFPGCATHATVFIGDQPVGNVEIAHIADARAGSARYDPTMTDAQRGSLANLILLCHPHHHIVDRLHADDYPRHVLERWKSEREKGGLHALEGLGGLTEQRLTALLEEAACTARPQRDVTIEAQGGVLMSPGSIVAGPFGW